jgi:LacI family transcriptional regulator
MVSLQDVARKAGVSLATASKALHQGVESDRIGGACRQRVVAACQELGYRPNHLARSLQSGKAGSIGSLFGETTQNLENAVLWYVTSAGMMAAALGRKTQVVTIGASRRESPIDAALQAAQEKRVDGLVVPPFLLSPARVKQLEASDVPIVLVAYPKATQLPTVEVDDEAGAVQEVEHLHRLGHRRMLWVAPGDTRDYYERRRRRAVYAAAADRDMTVQDIAGDYSLRRTPRKEDQIRLARQAMLAYWRPYPDPITAVMAYNEAIGLGVYAAAAELGLRIPGDLSVVAFDDFYAHVAWPPMTVVSLMMYELGVRAVEVLLEMVGDQGEWNRFRGWRQKIPCQLIVRGSTACPPGPNQHARRPGRHGE